MEPKARTLTEQTDGPKVSFLAYIQCFFLSVATILGTGILGLPLMLSHCGFYPFLCTFIFSYLMQMLAVYFVLQLLQVCQSALEDTLYEVVDADQGSKEMLLLRHQMSDRVTDENSLFPIEAVDGRQNSLPDQEDGEEIGVLVDKAAVTSRPHPNLYLLGKLFLNKWIAYGFYILLFLHFNSILISYVLAGSEAYGQLLQIDYVTVMPVFMWTLTAIVVLMFRFLQPVIALMTLAKGSILVVTIFVTCYVGFSVHNPITDSWSKMDEPFLMEAVALGGLPMVMPMLYGKFSGRKSHVRGFRASLYAGLTVCMLLNVTWSWAVLNVVPQTDPACHAPVSFNANNSRLDVGMQRPVPERTVSYSSTPGGATELGNEPSCDPKASLEGAKNVGLISTVPLTQFIITHRPEYRWIAVLLQMFIVISITVSYLTIGSAMQHTVIGLVDYIVDRRATCPATNLLSTFCVRSFVWHGVCGLASFLLVFVIAISDPKGFVNILDKLVSMTINFIMGPIVFLMLRRSRSRTFRHLKVPLPGHPWLYHARFLLPLFFGGALVYELVVSVAAAVQRSQ